MLRHFILCQLVLLPLGIQRCNGNLPSTYCFSEKISELFRVASQSNLHPVHLLCLVLPLGPCYNGVGKGVSL